MYNNNNGFNPMFKKWSQDEMDTLIRLHNEGAKISEYMELLPDRTVGAVEAKLKSIERIENSKECISRDNRIVDSLNEIISVDNKEIIEKLEVMHLDIADIKKKFNALIDILNKRR